MANSFNTQPIYLDTDTSTGGGTNWRGASGNTIGVQGIRVVKIVVAQADAAVASVVGNIVVTDPAASAGRNQLLTIPVIAVTQTPVEIDLEDANACWRDFVVTGLTATKCALQISYRL